MLRNILLLTNFVVFASACQGGALVREQSGLETPPNEAAPASIPAVPLISVGIDPVDCPAANLLSLGSIANSPGDSLEPTVVELYEGGQLSRQGLTQHNADGTSRTRHTLFAGACPVVNVDSWFDGQNQEPVRIEQNVIDGETAAMIISAYMPPPRSYVAWWDHDVDGNLARQQMDLGSDGIVDVEVIREFDAIKRLVREQVLHLTDGEQIDYWSFGLWREPPRDRQLTYDDAGNVVRLETVSESGVTLTENEYDAAGQLLWERYSEDERVRREETWTYAAPARPLTHVVEHGTEVNSWEWTWASDESATIEHIAARNGNVWRAEREILNAAGQRIYYHQDQPYDGFIDWVEERTWREDGSPLTYVARSLVSGGSGETYHDDVWRYDAQGRVIEFMRQGRYGQYNPRLVYSYADAGREGPHRVSRRRWNGAPDAFA